ncbi:MAG: MFS transporter [Bacteroidaceae bacterium]|nr:MFS transporter [Bacteroidaceae bacterium]
MTDEKVTLREKVGYSMGDVAANLVFQMMMIFQLKFYTDIFGLDGAVAGSVLLIARIVDAFVDPAVGILTDRTQTRWGKYRPWVLWTAIPFCVFYVLAFWNPGIEQKSLVALYATVSYVLLMSMYSLNNTPYSALGGVMTGDIRERTSITSIRFIGSTIAQFVVQGLTLPLVAKFGGQDEAHGWLCTISLYAAICFVCFLITFASARERIAPPPQQEMNIRKDVQELLSNVPWRSMFVLTLFVFITLAMWGSAMSFYFQSYVDQDALFTFLEGMGLVRPEGEGNIILSTFNLIAHSQADAYAIGFSLFNMIGALVQFVGVILLSNFLANRYGKRKTFIVCLSLTVVFTAMFWLPGPQDVTSMFVLCVLKSLAYAPTVPLLWAMIGDVADHIEYVNHRRATGFCFSGVVFALKAGLGLGGAFAGLILSGFGYASGLNVVQSEEAVQGIRLVSSLVPALLFAVGVAALFFYPISKQFNEQMQAELRRRRESAAQ